MLHFLMKRCAKVLNDEVHSAANIEVSIISVVSMRGNLEILNNFVDGFLEVTIKEGFGSFGKS